MKALLTTLTALLVLSSCDGKERQKINVGDKIIDHNKPFTVPRNDNHYSNGITLPKNAKNVIYLGNGWVSFELNGTKFLYADHARSSVLANFNECK